MAVTDLTVAANLSEGTVRPALVWLVTASLVDRNVDAGLPYTFTWRPTMPLPHRCAPRLNEMLRATRDANGEFGELAVELKRVKDETTTLRNGG